MRYDIRDVLQGIANVLRENGDDVVDGLEDAIEQFEVMTPKGTVRNRFIEEILKLSRQIKFAENEGLTNDEDVIIMFSPGLNNLLSIIEDCIQYQVVPLSDLNWYSQLHVSLSDKNTTNKFRRVKITIYTLEGRYVRESDRIRFESDGSSGKFSTVTDNKSDAKKH